MPNESMDILESKVHEWMIFKNAIMDEFLTAYLT
jgi:hypothetical protein